MSEIIINHRVPLAPVKASFRRHYVSEINRTIATLDGIKVGKLETERSCFISPRHADNFNDFERHWVSPLEEIR